jgi:hypothetical protein
MRKSGIAVFIVGVSQGSDCLVEVKPRIARGKRDQIILVVVIESEKSRRSPRVTQSSIKENIRIVWCDWWAINFDYEEEQE